MKVQVQRAELIDDFWRDGLLLDSTYLRALVVDGVTPHDAAERLKHLKSENPFPASRDYAPVGELTMVYRR